MGGNRRREPVRAPQYNGKSAPVRALGDVPIVSSSPIVNVGAALANDGSAQLYEAAATAFSQIGSRIGKFADEAAIAEGEREGRKAGLDPEFRPRGDLTLYSKSYDAAGIDTAKRRISVSLSEQMDAAFDKNAHNPKGLAKAQAAIRAGIDKGLTPELAEVIRPELDAQYRRQQIAHTRQAQRNLQSQMRAEQLAAVNDDVTVRLRRVQQSAYRLGLDETADKILAAEVTELRQQLSIIGPDGQPLVKPSTAKKMLRQTEEQITTARLLGAFGRLEGLDSKGQFLADMEKDFAAGKGLAGVFDLDGFRRAQGIIAAEYNRAKAEANVINRDLERQVKDVAALAGKGFAIPDEQLSALQAKVVASGSTELTASLESAQETLQWQRAMRVLPPDQLDEIALEARQQLNDGGASPAQVARVEVLERLADTARTELKKDPLGWADRVGLVDVEPVDFSSEDAGVASMTMRIAQSDEVSQRYGIAPQYLRPDERAKFSQIASRGGRELIAISSALVSAAGDKSSAVLAEVFDEAPAVAMIGGLVDSLGITPTAQDAADGIALRQEDGFKTLIPSKQVLLRLTNDVLGTTLRQDSVQKIAAVEVANAIYETRARRRGITDFDGDLWQHAFREVFGERTIDGEKYGGVRRRDVGFFYSTGDDVVVPTDVKQAGFDELVESIRMDDLVGAFGAPLGVDGKPLSMRDVRRSRLVSAGDGKYFLATSGLDDDQPRWAVDSDGLKYVLDLDKLAPTLRKRRPDLYLGSR